MLGAGAGAEEGAVTGLRVEEGVGFDDDEEEEAEEALADALDDEVVAFFRAGCFGEAADGAALKHGVSMPSNSSSETTAFSKPNPRSGRVEAKGLVAEDDDEEEVLPLLLQAVALMAVDGGSR